MKIAIQAADLDAERIDGTRVYIHNLLKYFGALDSSSEFLIYHKSCFNPELKPPEFPNYEIIRKNWPLFWTQARLSSLLWRERPDVLWMPMHNIPYFRPKGMKTVVTIHDLAFKYFPETFTKKNLLEINLLTKLAVRKADKIIAISESSKKDILKFYPEVKEEKIKVIYHGFDREVFSQPYDAKATQNALIGYGVISKNQKLKIKNQNDNSKLKNSGEIRYVLYIGAIQPRKNLVVLIEAFEKIKAQECYGDLKLVLAGEKAWLWKDVLEKIEASPYKQDIILPGKIKFENLGHLMRGAEVFCFPSLYEGFGIPVLEAFAARVPVICAGNSSLPEAGGEAALYFDGRNSRELADKLKNILEDDNLKNELIEKGVRQAKNFSWEKCAKETLEYIKS